MRTSIDKLVGSKGSNMTGKALAFIQPKNMLLSVVFILDFPKFLPK